MSEEKIEIAPEEEIAPKEPPKSLSMVDGVELDRALAKSWPKDRVFRAAWKHEKGSVVVDMARARDVHRDRLRRDRAPLLQALDVEYMRAIERDADAAEKARITAEKQRLRDITDDPRIDSAKTPEELKALTVETM